MRIAIANYRTRPDSSQCGVLIQPAIDKKYSRIIMGISNNRGLAGGLLQIMNKEVYESLKRIIKYLYDDEFKHWEESDKPENHIYKDIMKVVSWIDEYKKEVNE